MLFCSDGSLHQISVEDFCCMDLILIVDPEFNNIRPQCTKLFFLYIFKNVSLPPDNSLFFIFSKISALKFKSTQNVFKFWHEKKTKMSMNEDCLIFIGINIPMKLKIVRQIACRNSTKIWKYKQNSKVKFEKKILNVTGRSKGILNYCQKKKTKYGRSCLKVVFLLHGLIYLGNNI